MNLIIDIKARGRFFSVPCSVVDKYIKLADGVQLKVLLKVLCNDYDVIYTEKVAEDLGISVNEVDDAILFWTNQGVITSNISNVGTVISTPSFENSHEKEENLSVIPSENPSNHSVSSITSVKYSPKDIQNLIEKDEDIRYMFDNAQLVLKRPITHTEQAMLINLHEYYGFSFGSILMILEYCEQIKKTSARYIEAVAKSWAEKEIITHEDVEKEIIRLTNLNSFEVSIKEIFGINSNFSTKQREFLSSWKEMGFERDMISFAYDRCMDQTGKLSFPYINKILTSWFEKGINTLELAEADVISKPNKKVSKNTSYDLDEIDKIIFANEPKYKKK